MVLSFDRKCFLGMGRGHVELPCTAVTPANQCQHFINILLKKCEMIQTSAVLVGVAKQLCCLSEN